MMTPYRRVLEAALVGVLAAVLVGCGKASTPASHDDHTDAGAPPRPDAWVGIDEETTPAERRYLEAAKPFVVALAGRDYAAAYGLLSSHARARMSLNQFAPPDDDDAANRNDATPVPAVTAEQFGQLMRHVETRFGSPQRPRDLHVFSVDPEVLSGRKAKQPQDPTDALDVLFAIGGMPESIPAAIRRASLRGQITTELSSQELERLAKEAGVTPEELQKDPDFGPYFNFKLVLVEEDGQLRVGYFEFLPPSMLD